MSTSALTLPERPGGRLGAQDLLAHFTADVAGGVVSIDGRQLAAVASSFMDELVKGFLIERGARQLILEGAPERANFYALASAQRRGVSDQLVIRAA